MLCRLIYGTSAWITCFISIDRFLMVYYQANYSIKETKYKVIGKIIALVIFHVVLSTYVSFLQYIPSFNQKDPGTFELMNAYISYDDRLTLEFLASRNIVHGIRLLMDRAIPWILCPATYAAIFIIRKRQKNLVTATSTSAAATEARKRAEQQNRQSRRLVIAITLSMFISQLPDAIIDVLEYFTQQVGVFSSLKGNLTSIRIYIPGLPLILFAQTIVDPIICILSFPKLKDTVKWILYKIKSLGN